MGAKNGDVPAATGGGTATTGAGTVATGGGTVATGGGTVVTGGGAIALERKITLIGGVAIIVGTIVGSGIFLTPMGVFAETRAAGTSLVVWTLSGLFSCLGALCYAELGTIISRSGGDYAYIHEAFGPVAGFVRLWLALVILRPTTTAIVALTFAEYAAKPFMGECPAPEWVVRLLAASCLCLLTAVNALSTQWAMRVQTLFTWAKLLVLALIVGAGVLSLSLGWGEGRTALHAPPFQGNHHPNALALAFYSGLFAFGGWNYLNFVTEELKDPYRNLPRAIWIALPLVTLVYIMANVAYFGVLSPEELLASKAVAVTFGNKALGLLAPVVPIFVSLSTFGGVNGILFTSSRLFVAGAQQGHLPAVFSFIHCATSVMMLVVADVFVLIEYFSQVLWLSVGACVLGLLQLRRNRPHLDRPIRVPLVIPFLFLAACIVLVAVPAWNDPLKSTIGALITLTGVPVYYICLGRKDNPAWLQRITEKVTLWTQCLLEVVKPEESEKMC